MLTYRRADDLDEYNEIPMSPNVTIQNGIITKRNPVLDDNTLQQAICDVMYTVRCISDFIKQHNTKNKNYYNEQYIIEYQDFLNKYSTEFSE